MKPEEAMLYAFKTLRHTNYPGQEVTNAKARLTNCTAKFTESEILHAADHYGNHFAARRNEIVTALKGYKLIK